MGSKPLLALAISMLCAGAGAGQAEIVFIAPTNHSMPLAGFDNGTLSAGIIKDLGDAIALGLGRKARYVNVPSRRVSRFLSSGQADGLCYVLPHWIPGQFDWSAPLVANASVIVARSDAPAVAAFGQLADRAVGTVSGYDYPQLDAALGARFVRDDAPSMDLMLRKLLAGRSQYAVVDKATLDYHVRADAASRLRVDLVFGQYMARCAFSRQSQVPFAQVEHVIQGLLDDGSVQRILLRYR
ncbi:MAG: transporter substrate-binding domain-containing protein [Pseudomonadota bacterium]